MPSPDPLPPVRSIGDDPTVMPASLGDAATVTPGASAAPTIHAPPAAPPGFVIERELGRGGMGIVYLARQAGLNRPVALKMILGAGNAERKHLIRFLAEAEAVASVRHPNVVEVYQYGEHAGQPFMALEFCPGGSLADGLKDGPLEPELAAETLAAVAEGVAAAHAQGIVHRDLKPHNVLVTDGDVPKVTDFGLAKRETGESELTKTNAVMGTPAYMAPEQAQGGTKFVGPPADVWALGVMLYELLAGERPFGGDDTWSVLASVIKAEVVPVRKKVPGVPRDLELICHKCLYQDPRDRYPSAAELAADLRHFLAGEPVSVRPPGRVELAVRWVRRNKVVAGAMTAVAMALVAGTAVSLAQANRAREQARRADDEAVNARTAEADAIREALSAKAEARRANTARHAIQMDSAFRSWETRDFTRAVQILGSLPPEYRDTWEARYLRNLTERSVRARIGRSGPVRAVAFRPDGKRFAVGGGKLDENHFPLPGELSILDVETGAVVRTLSGHPGPVTRVEFSPDGRRLITGSDTDHTIRVWDIETGRQLSSLPSATPLMWHADGKRIVVSASPTTKGDSPFKFWDPEREAALAPAFALPEGEALVAVDRATARVVTARAPFHQSKEITVRDAASGEKLGVIPATPPAAVCLTPDGKKLIAGQESVIKVWDVATGRELRTLTGHTRVVSCLTTDGTVIVSGSQDATARVWEVESGRPLHVLKGHSTNVSSVRLSPDGRRMLSGGGDLGPRPRPGEVILWELDPRPESASLTASLPILSLDVSADGKRVAAAGGDLSRMNAPGELVVWDVATGKPITSLPPQTPQASGVRFSPDGTTLAARTQVGTVVLWDVAAQRPRLTIPAPVQLMPCNVDFHPDGTRVVSSSADLRTGPNGVVKVWDARDGKEVHSLQGHKAFVTRTRFSPDGKRIVSASTDRTARVWDAETGQSLLTLTGHDLLVSDARISADGSRVATASGDKTLKLWDATTGREQLTLSGHTFPVVSTAFNADGTRVVSAANDPNDAGVPGEVFVWDVATGQIVFRLSGHAGAVSCVEFGRDGRRLVTGGADRTVKAWGTE